MGLKKGYILYLLTFTYMLYVRKSVFKVIYSLLSTTTYGLCDLYMHRTALYI